MTTDFFEQQDSARRKTGLLVVYFVLAIVCLIALVYALLLALNLYDTGEAVSIWQPELLLLVAAGVGVVVGGASVFKVAQLASGGQAVALMMGGAEVPGTTRDAHERQLLNVVEEMALAAGVPVPPVYVLDEPGINAFAAGYAPGDAVVAVSRGCLHYLTRDELQGVVAHEFSHILNGDMRLNIRLIALIFGIIALSLLGRILMFSAGRRGSSSNRRDAQGGMVIFGLGLFVLGLVGAFFGRLIQAAVSRQREYLADASAVQFTRNPDGIAGALKKIGGLKEGSRVENPRAEEVGHMFFANAFGGGLSSLLATHPPLEDRIRRIDPTFTGEYPEVRPVDVDRAEPVGRRPGRAAPTGGLPTLPGLPQVPLSAVGLAAEQAAARVGRVTPNEIHHAAAMHADMPAALRDAAREPFGARAVVYALLLDPRADMRDLQLGLLETGAGPADRVETLRLAAPVRALPDGLRLPLLDLAMPALRQMSQRQHQAFRSQVEALMNADRRLSLFEYTLRCVLHRHLDAQFLPRQQPRGPLENSPRRLAPAVAKVLAILAWEGQPEPDQAAKAFAAGMRNFAGDGNTYRLPPREESSLAELDAALQTLNRSVPAVKRRTVMACEACILADRQVSVRESELLRAICDTLDCPLPPLVAGDADGR
jgi:Zn-dependent protease with chaperone function